VLPVPFPFEEAINAIRKEFEAKFEAQEKEFEAKFEAQEKEINKLRLELKNEKRERTALGQKIKDEQESRRGRWLYNAVSAMRRTEEGRRHVFDIFKQHCFVERRLTLRDQGRVSYPFGQRGLYGLVCLFAFLTDLQVDHGWEEKVLQPAFLRAMHILLCEQRNLPVQIIDTHRNSLQWLRRDGLVVGSKLKGKKTEQSVPFSSLEFKGTRGFRGLTSVINGNINEATTRGQAKDTIGQALVYCYQDVWFQVALVCFGRIQQRHLHDDVCEHAWERTYRTCCLVLSPDTTGLVEMEYDPDRNTREGGVSVHVEHVSACFRKDDGRGEGRCFSLHVDEEKYRDLHMWVQDRQRFKEARVNQAREVQKSSVTKEDKVTAATREDRSEQEKSGDGDVAEQYAPTERVLHSLVDLAMEYETSGGRRKEEKGKKRGKGKHKQDREPNANPRKGEKARSGPFSCYQVQGNHLAKLEELLSYWVGAYIVPDRQDHIGATDFPSKYDVWMETQQLLLFDLERKRELLSELATRRDHKVVELTKVSVYPLEILGEGGSGCAFVVEWDIDSIQKDHLQTSSVRRALKLAKHPSSIPSLLREWTRWRQHPVHQCFVSVITFRRPPSHGAQKEEGTEQEGVQDISSVLEQQLSELSMNERKARRRSASSVSSLANPTLSLSDVHKVPFESLSSHLGGLLLPLGHPWMYRGLRACGTKSMHISNPVKTRRMAYLSMRMLQETGRAANDEGRPWVHRDVRHANFIFAPYDTSLFHTMIPHYLQYRQQQQEKNQNQAQKKKRKQKQKQKQEKEQEKEQEEQEKPSTLKEPRLCGCPEERNDVFLDTLLSNLKEEDRLRGGDVDLPSMGKFTRSDPPPACGWAVDLVDLGCVVEEGKETEGFEGSSVHVPFRIQKREQSSRPFSYTPHRLDDIEVFFMTFRHSCNIKDYYGVRCVCKQCKGLEEWFQRVNGNDSIEWMRDTLPDLVNEADQLMSQWLSVSHSSDDERKTED